MTLISREILQRALRWSKKRKILTSLFAVYIFAVLWLTLLDRQWGERQAELVPFLGGAKPFGEHKHQVSAGFLAGTDIRKHCNVYPLGCFAPVSLRCHKVQKSFPFVPCLFSRYRDNAVYHRQRTL